MLIWPLSLKSDSTITYRLRNHYMLGTPSLILVEGLVNYLLQDHSIATEKAAGFHTTPYKQVSLVRKHKKWFLVSVHQSSPLVQSSDCRRPCTDVLMLLESTKQPTLLPRPLQCWLLSRTKPLMAQVVHYQLHSLQLEGLGDLGLLLLKTSSAICCKLVLVYPTLHTYWPHQFGLLEDEWKSLD